MANEEKPLRILSTSLGIALAANLLLIPMAHGENSADSAGKEKPKLVEWSSDEVKKYFDPNVDWNIPFPVDNQKNAINQGQGSNGTGSSGPAYVGSVRSNGFGWDDLMLYHMIFNSGSPYSASSWSQQRPTYDARTNQRYKSSTFDSGAFQNKPVVNSRVNPKTVDSSGTIIRRSSTKASSAPRGSIGGESGGFSSSGHASGGSFGG
jgi:hypothetical protein